MPPYPHHSSNALGFQVAGFLTTLSPIRIARALPQQRCYRTVVVASREMLPAATPATMAAFTTAEGPWAPK